MLHTDFLDIVVGILKIDTMVTFLFLINPDYVLRTSINQKKKYSFTLKKKARGQISLIIKAIQLRRNNTCWLLLAK